MEQSDERFCVYTHTRPDTGAIFYVGIGTRFRPYNKSGRNTHWKNIVAKNNGKFFVEILYSEVSFDFAVSKEKYLISKYGRKDKGAGALCNKTDGGEGVLGRIVSEVTRKKLSTYSGIHHSMYGTKRTPETKKRISEANKGKQLSTEFRQHLRDINVGKKLSEVVKRKISEANKGDKNHFFGKKHSFQSKKKMSEAKLGVKGSNYGNFRWYIDQIDPITNHVIATYDGLFRAELITKVNRSNIREVIYGMRKKAGGYRWQSRPNPEYKSKTNKAA